MIKPYFGNRGKWRNMSGVTRSITDLEDAHLANAALWCDRQITALGKRPPAKNTYRSLRYVIKKREELVAELFRRSLVIKVGVEPPDPLKFYVERSNEPAGRNQSDQPAHREPAEAAASEDGGASAGGVPQA